MTQDFWRHPRAALLALHILTMGALAAPVPALAMQIWGAWWWLVRRA